MRIETRNVMAERAREVTISSRPKKRTIEYPKIKKNMTATKVGIKSKYTSPHKKRHRASVVFSIIFGAKSSFPFDFILNPLILTLIYKIIPVKKSYVVYAFIYYIFLQI